MGKGKFYQTLTAVASAFGSFIMGLLYVWPSYTIGLYRAENTTLLTVPMSPAEESLVGSLPPLGAMLGTAVVGSLIERFGRKLGGLALTLPYVLSWGIIAASSSSLPILVARFIGGISGGASLVFAPMFISEVAEDSIRGTLASAPITFTGFGSLISYLLGWFFGYYTIIWINLVCCIIWFGLLLMVAESPVYLLKRNRDEDARNSLAVYRGASPQSVLINEELSRLKQQIRPASEKVSVNVKSVISCRALYVVLSVVSMQVLMGILPVQVYAKQVFTQADPGKADLYSVIFALVMLGGNVVAGAIADKAGRRVLIITSSAMVAVCMASLGFLLQTRLAPAWVTVVMILVCCFSFMCGAGSIPYVLLAEVFTSEVQAVASTIIIEWAWFLNFLILVVFNFLNSLIGIHGTFYIFAVNAVINATISFFMVPETKGLSNAQIQEAFAKSRRK